MFHPVPTGIESCIWQHAKFEITLAEFSPTRARIRLALEGDEYRPSELGAEFVMKELSMQESLLTTAGIANYYVWLGIYTMLREQMEETDDWRAFLRMYDTANAILGAPDMRAGAISAVTGHEVATNMNYGCCFNIDLSGMAIVHELKGHIRLDESYPDAIPITALPCYVSGSLALGTVVDEAEYCRHLSSVQEYTGATEMPRTHEREQALMLANMYRLFGHDVEATDVTNRTVETPYAAAHSCVIEAYSVYKDHATVYNRIISDNEERDGRHHVLPYIQNVLRGGRTTMTIDRPTIKFTAYQERTKALTTRPMFTRKSKGRTLHIRSNLATRPTTLMGKVPTPRPPQDFTDTDTVAPALPPEGKKGKVIVDIPELGVGASGADLITQT
jgi:hypothetical protein